MLVPVVLTGGDGDGSAGEAAPDGGVSAAVPTETRSARPPDRDMQAITVALRQLDPCKLLDVQGARSRGAPNAATIATGPHACMMVVHPDYSPADENVSVRVGALSDHFSRYSMAPIELNGARAYLYQQGGSARGHCRVDIPVSFTRAIVFEHETYDKRDVCPALRRYAGAAVAKLGSPDSLTIDRDTRPFSQWDGCSFLSQVLGQEADMYTFQPHHADGVADPFSGCATTDKSGKAEATTPELDVRYKEAPEPSGQAAQIAGKTVYLEQLGPLCEATWNNGPSGVRNKWFATTLFTITTGDCDVAARLAEQAISLAGGKPSHADAQPQRPLLYGPDENDTGSLGACVDFRVTGGNADCEPYQEVPVPEAPDQILKAAGVNRHVQCAVFKEAVQGVFGTAFKPVTWGEHCYFVEPEHVLTIQVNVDPRNVPNDYGNRPDLYLDRQVTDIAGKPAVTYWTKRREHFDIYLSPSGDLSQRGNLHIGIETKRGRGREADLPEVTPEQAQQASEVMAHVVQKHFS
ncbi:hypothetical protein B0I33_10943 [Prauserella shujinwangii]|uniref:Uncharacterized protein n=1 Tax=Prauserella shujinwangii TaxID=1453103 RepID=A0A2T0LQ00_9PSEU|nr:hypothetical protein B0I33_10943 [Prauserella shujinwangii]